MVIATLIGTRNVPDVFAQLTSDLYEVRVVDGKSVYQIQPAPSRLRLEGRMVTQARRSKATALAYGLALATAGGFEVETLIHLHVARAGRVFAVVPSLGQCRTHGVSNLNAIRVGYRVLRTEVMGRRRARRWTEGAQANALPQRLDSAVGQVRGMLARSARQFSPGSSGASVDRAEDSCEGAMESQMSAQALSCQA
jgi:hypothetical protein